MQRTHYLCLSSENSDLSIKILGEMTASFLNFPMHKQREPVFPPSEEHLVLQLLIIPTRDIPSFVSCIIHGSCASFQARGC